MAEGAKEASGFTRRAFRVRRKEETLRRQEKQTHSEAAEEERSEGRNEPLSDWNAIVAGDVSVFPCPGPVFVWCFPRSSVAVRGQSPFGEESLTDGEVLPQAPRSSSHQATTNQHYEKPCYAAKHISVNILGNLVTICMHKVDALTLDSMSVYILSRLCYPSKDSFGY